MLITWLPPESATKTAIRDAMSPEEREEAKTATPRGGGPWSQQLEILASIRDSIEWVRHAVIRSQGGKCDQPDPYPRPDRPGRSAVRVDPEATEYLDRIRAARAAGQVEPEPETTKEAAVLYLDRLRRNRGMPPVPPAAPSPSSEPV